MIYLRYSLLKQKRRQAEQLCKTPFKEKETKISRDVPVTPPQPSKHNNSIGLEGL